jgi:hypothetical protein
MDIHSKYSSIIQSENVIILADSTQISVFPTESDEIMAGGRHSRGEVFCEKYQLTSLIFASPDFFGKERGLYVGWASGSPIK